MAAPAPMPVISRNVPAYTNDDFGGSFPASNANNAIYGSTNYWRCQTTPAGNADSGVLTQAVWLAYDMSAVPSVQRQQVVVVWYNDPMTDPYDSSILATNYFNSPQAYVLESNTAPGGGAPPASGWSTLVSVTGEARHSRQHAINLTGANWVRFTVSAINGSISNNNVAVNLDIHDCHVANVDNIVAYGDSIPQRGLDHDDFWIPAGTLPAQINAQVPTNYPLIEDAGIGGLKAADVVANNYLSEWLPLFTGKYVMLNYGTNDANAGGSPVANYLANMTSLVTQVLDAGKTPIIQKSIPWGSAAGIAANGPAINAALASLFASYPQIIPGPDLWSYFAANQNLISSDGIHPTDPAAGTGNGYIAYRAQWAAALVANVYTAAPAPPAINCTLSARAGNVTLIARRS